MRAYKTEVKLNKEQEQLYKLCVSAKRIVWNLFIEENEKSEKYINAYTFSKWFNNEYLPMHEDMLWLKKAESKTLRYTMDLCHKAYVNAFNKKKRFPKKKSPKNFNEGFYFVRNSLTQPIKVERHKIKVPMFGWVTLKEKGYLPLEGIVRGVIKKKAGRYFISIVVEEKEKFSILSQKEGLGIDLGVKEFMICSDGILFRNINKTTKVKKLEKKLSRNRGH